MMNSDRIPGLPGVAKEIIWNVNSTLQAKGLRKAFLRRPTDGLGLASFI